MSVLTNHDYWLSRQHDFPAHVRQVRDKNTGPQTIPEQLSTNRHGGFLRVPLDTEVLWGFSSDLHAERFVSDFGGELLPPTA